MTNDYKKIYQDGQESVETLPFVFINISLLILVRFCFTLFVVTIGDPQPARTLLQGPGTDRCKLFRVFFKFNWPWPGPSFFNLFAALVRVGAIFPIISCSQISQFFGAGPFLGPGPIGFGPWIPGHYKHSDHYQTQLQFCLVIHQRMLFNSLMLPMRKNLLPITKPFGDQGRIWPILFKTF